MVCRRMRVRARGGPALAHVLQDADVALAARQRAGQARPGGAGPRRRWSRRGGLAGLRHGGALAFDEGMITKVISQSITKVSHLRTSVMGTGKGDNSRLISCD